MSYMIIIYIVMFFLTFSLSALSLLTEKLYAMDEGGPFIFPKKASPAIYYTFLLLQFVCALSWILFIFLDVNREWIRFFNKDIFAVIVGNAIAVGLVCITSACLHTFFHAAGLPIKEYHNKAGLFHEKDDFLDKSLTMINLAIAVGGVLGLLYYVFSH